MGLSSSQTRLLMLTARRSNLEYEGQQLNQQRAALANTMGDLAKLNYTGMSNRRIYLFVDQESPMERATYANLTSANYRFIDKAGNIVTNDKTLFDNPNINREDYIYNPNVDDPDLFEKWLRDGDLIMQKQIFEGNNSKWKDTTWSSETVIRDNLYADDDAAVGSEYEMRLADVQNKDKQMELRLKEVETEHKSIETEYEAVKKVITENIKLSFKTFA